MIKYRLVCREGHEFEGWFRSSEAFDTQAGHSLVNCPHCGTDSVSKAIMSPHVVTRAPAAKANAEPSPEAESVQQTYAMLHKLRQSLEARAEYVGARFAEEARRIHYAESAERGIYGEASPDEVAALADEGISVFPVPRLRDDLN